MRRYSLSHLADHVLLRDLTALVSQERTITATLLAHLAEVDERKLYLPAAYPSMHAWCVGELHMSEDAASKRIHAARAARQFPAIFPALADGRLHLSAVVLLAPRLTEETAEELLAAAAHRTKAEIEVLIAQRFPRPDLPSRVQAIAPPRLASEHAPGHVEASPEQHAPGHVEGPAPPARVAPLSSERFALQLTIGQGTHDKLRRAQELLGHAVPSGDVAQVLDRALDALLTQLEKRKFAATSRPGPRRRSENVRHVPADVRRKVWQRDGGRCTFESDRGKRCEARTRLETIWNDGLAVAKPQWRECGSGVARTTSTPPSKRTGPSSCATSEKQRDAGRSRPARRSARARGRRPRKLRQPTKT